MIQRPSGIPPWLWAATEELYRERERIEGDEMNEAQIAHDPEEGEYTWKREVAAILLKHFNRSKR